MKWAQREFNANGSAYAIRPAEERDAEELSRLRLQADGETENLDREPGEDFMDRDDFVRLIELDTESSRSLFLVAEADGKLAGFSRCQGSHLKRSEHKVDFGIMILQPYWGIGIGRNLLQESIRWADSNGIAKIALSVVESNVTAIRLYEKMGFSVEGVLKNDKLLSGGRYCNTIVMGRINGERQGC
ncbi:RimJ/RimL family protein N-acetyltransferase [Planomicrobium koreense]|uniref:RimJ/RimL family protein N-acetyltransferase n=1 Tax=Planococcus koreensis TaxID=112331 RepID=A0A7W8CVG9_9BACL|nr:GNAT family N-acetyltransferase [Planococcus koreensis]MBB5181144.1 RimJ/RimL family protein N-acetyltransferase [Planococcus koreensis]